MLNLPEVQGVQVSVSPEALVLQYQKTLSDLHKSCCFCVGSIINRNMYTYRLYES